MGTCQSIDLNGLPNPISRDRLVESGSGNITAATAAGSAGTGTPRSVILTRSAIKPWSKLTVMLWENPGGELGNGPSLPSNPSLETLSVGILIPLSMDGSCFSCSRWIYICYWASNSSIMILFAWHILQRFSLFLHFTRFIFLFISWSKYTRQYTTSFTNYLIFLLFDLLPFFGRYRNIKLD